MPGKGSPPPRFYIHACMTRQILVVDDDPVVSALVQEMLLADGHSVRICNDATTAIREIADTDYDVLITDLNISNPGDGYLLAGVSKTLRPKALVYLLTGLPDLESAWKSIQSFVDRLLLKPANSAELQRLVRSVETPAKATLARLDLSSLIAAHEEDIVNDWLAHVEADPVLAAIPMDRENRLDDLVPILKAIEARLRHPEQSSAPARIEAARNHGRNRRQHGYPIPALLREGSHLRQSITRLVSNHFLDIDPYHALRDLFQVHSLIDESIARSLEAYIGD